MSHNAHTGIAARIRCWSCIAAGVLVCLHPLIHGTPLDSGALDTIFLHLQAYALSGGE